LSIDGIRAESLQAVNAAVSLGNDLKWWPETGSNRRRRPFQGRALPLSYLASVPLQEITNWRGNHATDLGPGGDTALLQQLPEYIKTCRYLQTSMPPTQNDAQNPTQPQLGPQLNPRSHFPLNPAKYALIKSMAIREFPIRRRAKSILLLAANLFALSLLWAASALRPELLPGLVPEPLPYFASLVVPLLLFAVVAALFARWRETRLPLLTEARTALLLGIALFALPALLIYFARSIVASPARTILFCLIPILTTVLQPYLGRAHPASRYALLAALLALLGALCIFPIEYPQTPEAILAFAALVFAAGSIGIANCLAEAAAHPQTASVFPATTAFPFVAAIATATGALTLTLASAFFDRVLWTGQPSHPGLAIRLTAYLPALLWTTFIDLPALLLLFWSFQRLSAVRLSTRYLFAPLLTILVGTALLRAQDQIQPRTWLGLLLMAAGAAYLLFAADPESGTDSNPTTLFPSNSKPPAQHPD
jgi:drug/metabolite transporter (DMT)-like permease